MANKMIDDTACIASWRELISEFNKLIDNSPSPDKIKNELLEIKNKAKINGNLTYHQVQALTARCDNYLKGEYGISKKGVQMKAA
jgi:hypothetical protein